MATLADLENAITQVVSIPGVSAVLQLNGASRERAFEAYIFSLLVKSVRQAGGTATITGIKSGPNPSPIVFRGGPGLLGSAAQDFAYADCMLGNRRFEIHLAVQYEGSSGAVHELDVSLYDDDAADRVRQDPNLFAKCNKLYVAIECKFYDSTLGTALGRTFVGLVDDCGTLKMKLFCTNGHSQGLARYFSQSRRPNPFFGLTPLRQDKELEFINFVKHTLSKWSGIA